MIHGSKAYNFYLPNPSEIGESRKDDADYVEKMKEINSLQLVHFDSDSGRIYIANGGHISIINSPYELKDSEKVAKSMTHHSIEYDDSYIRALRVVKHQNDSLIVVCVKSKALFFGINQDGSIGDKKHEISLKAEGNILALDSYTDNSGNLKVIVVDSTSTLNLLNFNTKAVTTTENILHACFAENVILAVNKESSKLNIIDIDDASKVLKEHDLEVEEPKAVHCAGDKTLFVFFEECFNLLVLDFDSSLNKDTLINFKVTNKTQFEEIFTPSDNMIDDESSHYWVKHIPNTNFNFVGGSFAESADVVYKDESGKWCLSSTEEQSLRMLAPVDSSDCICSFKGIAFYPFKLSSDESTTCMHKFTEEDIKIGYPKKLITLSYTGRLDCYQCYFKDILESKDKEPSAIKGSRNIPAPSVSGFDSMKGGFGGSNLEQRNVEIDNGKYEETTKEDTATLRAGLEELKMGNQKKSVSFEDRNNSDPESAKCRTPKSILKSSSSGSPVKEKESKRKQRESDLEDNILTLEQEEQMFLNSIQDNYSKLFLKTQYNLANDVNKSFRGLQEAQLETEGPYPQISETDRLKQRLYAYIIGSSDLMKNTASIADTMKHHFEETEKVHNYWDAVKNSDDQSHNQTSGKIGDNNLMSRKIEETIKRGEKVIEESSKFVHIVRSLTKQARSLNDKFNKARQLKLKGGLNDPLLKKYQNSGVLNKLMQEHKPGNEEWQQIEKKLRGPSRDTIDSDKNMRIYNTFVDELKENNGYLCKVLDQNYARLLIKMREYDKFNNSLEYDEPYDPSLPQHKYDFSAEVKGSSQPVRLQQNSQSPDVPLGLSATSIKSKENRGLIEINDSKDMQKQLESKIAAAHGTSGPEGAPTVQKVKMQPKKQERIVEQEDTSSEEGEPPKPVQGLSKDKGDNLPKVFQRQPSNKVLKDKKANANKIGMLVQDDMSFGDSSEESSDDDSDEFDDTLSEMRPNGKLAFKRIQTTLPDNLKLE